MIAVAEQLQERQVEIPYSPLEWVHASGYDMTTGRFEYSRPGFYDSAAKFRMVCGGRRLSKTLHAVPEFLRMGLDHEGVYWWVGSIFRTTKKAWRFWKRIRPMELVADESKVELYTKLKNGSEFFFMSAEVEESLSSEGLGGVVCDEMQDWRESAWACIQPTLIDHGGRAIGLFTARNNFTKRLYGNGLDPQLSAWDSWKFPTFANTSLSYAQISEGCQGMTERVYRQEILSEYVDEEGDVFRDPDGAAIGLELPGPVSGHRYVVSLDWGKRRDYTVATAIDISIRPRAAVARIRFNRVDYGFQLTRIKEFIDCWRPVKVKPEQNGIGDPLIDMLVRDLPMVYIEPVNIQSAKKAEIIEKLALDIERGQIVYPPWPELLNELRLFGYRTMRSGTLQYSAPDGAHDDCVMSLAIGNSEDSYLEPAITVLG